MIAAFLIYVMAHSCPAIPDGSVEPYLDRLSEAKFAAIHERNAFRRQLQTPDLADAEAARIERELKAAEARYVWLGDLWNHCINTRMRANTGTIEAATAALAAVNDQIRAAIEERERRRRIWRRVWRLGL